MTSYIVFDILKPYVFWKFWRRDLIISGGGRSLG